MKKVWFILGLILITLSAKAQNSVEHAHAQGLLNWFINFEKIKQLNPHVDISAFQISSLTKLKLLTEYEQPSLKRFDRFLTQQEINLFFARKNKVQWQLWIQTGYRFDARFYHPPSKPWETEELIWGLSTPLFLNKDYTRAILDATFYDGPAGERGDLVLCEIKNGHWEAVARTAVYKK